MALSNWATLALDVLGGFNKKGTLESLDRDGSVFLYKNWAYVEDKAMWNENSKFSEPIIAKVHSGEVAISRFDIYAKRTDTQNAILLYAGTTDKEYKFHKRMFGLGCYGFSETTSDWIGVSQALYDEFLDFIKMVVEEKYLMEEGMEFWIDNLPPTPMSYNQGDAYFAEKLGFDTPVSTPENVKKPIIMDLIKEIE